MKNFEVKFSLLKTLGFGLLMLVIAMFFTAISLHAPQKIKGENAHDTMGICIIIVLSGMMFFYLRRALYRKAVISINEKGVQLTYFCDVFIPWKDIEKVRLVPSSWGNSPRVEIIIIMLKDNEKYVNQYIKGMSQSAMQKNIRKYLSPIAIDTGLFETSIESIQELLEKGMENYKAKTATV